MLKISPKIRPSVIRGYVGVVPILSLVGGMSLMDGLHSWHRGDSSFWMAVVLVPICLGLSAFMTGKISKAIG